MKQFSSLFKKAGGFETIKQYSRARVLFFAMSETAILGLSKKSLEIVRLAVTNKIVKRLRKKYRDFICDFKMKNHSEEKIQSKKVWICWFQGMDNAPDIVKKCYASVKENFKDREIITITEENYRDYVTFPEYIQKKIDSGIISKTHMSDLLRLELLIKYGGTWIDSTVYCSGSDIPSYILNSDLFLFQCLKPGLDGHATSISSWFVTSCTNHPILMLTRELLYNYWKSHDKMIDYFLIHDFFQLAIEAYPEEWNKVVPFSNSVPHILLLRLFQPYDENIWNATKNMTCFHKLTYKFEESESKKSGTYYDVLLRSEKG